MAGRGRGLTLPAWMTEGGLQPVEKPETQSVATTMQQEFPPKPSHAPPQQQQQPLEQAPQQGFQQVKHMQQEFQHQRVQQEFQPPPQVHQFNHHNSNGIHTFQGPPSFPTPIQHMIQPASFNPYPNNNSNANGFPHPGQSMMNTFIPPMGQPNNFMMGGGFPNPALIPSFVPPVSMPMHLGAGMSVGGLGMNRPAMPAAMPQPKAPPPPAVIGDPNNDVSCWAEHESEAGKKYWYNRVSLVSTYDKPFCLKTPEERSIPACEWKEYAAADGKKYYSNGKESLWTMPDEFRVWKELVEAAEQKKLQQAVARAAQAADASLAASAAVETQKKESAAAARAVPAVVYASTAEAAEAFKELLVDMKVSAIAKMKETQDLCQHDARWEALKTQGEKKQALAEYQTKRLKLEKEAQKLKARKQRDAFLLMLAENTDIDARTRWRDATAILQDDARYKNVEDARDREDLFLEFINELEKKEKEDKRRAREAAIEQFNKVLALFAEDGKIDHRSVWANSKKDFLDQIVRPEFRAMDDSDFRRSFLAFTTQLQDAHRVEEKKRREEFDRALDAAQDGLRVVLEGIASGGRLTPETRWKELLALEEVTAAPAYVRLQALFPTEEDPEGGRFSVACKMVFTAVQDKVYEQYRLDRRLVKDIMHTHNFKIKHDMNFPQFLAFARKVARIPAPVEADGRDSVQPETTNSPQESNKETGPDAAVVAVVPVEVRSLVQEEGEEHDELPGDNLKAMMLERPFALSAVFDELHKKAVSDHEEELQYARKVEKKFASLLEDNFYRAEHAEIPWDEAKKVLQRRSVYDELSKTDRKRLFAEHMEALREKKGRSGSITGAAVAEAVEGPARASKDGNLGRGRSESKTRRRAETSRDRDRERGRGREHSHGRRVVVDAHSRDGKRSSERDQDDGGDGRGKRARAGDRK